MTPKKIQPYHCKHCNGTTFRAAVHQSVNVELEADGFVKDVGFDFSEPEADTDDVWCADCGEDVQQGQSLRQSDGSGRAQDSKQSDDVRLGNATRNNVGNDPRASDLSAMKWDKKCLNCGVPVERWEHDIISTAIIAWNRKGLDLEVAEAFGWVNTGPTADEQDERGEYVVCPACLAAGVREMVAAGPLSMDRQIPPSRQK